MSCKYADILGKPGTGVHSIRLFNIAVVDVLVTVLLAYFTKGPFNFWIVLLVWFIIGIIVHKIFCVKTTVGNIVSGN
jgi:accessory gene regulator protein AgrB